MTAVQIDFTNSSESFPINKFPVNKSSEKYSTFPSKRCVRDFKESRKLNTELF